MWNFEVIAFYPGKIEEQILFFFEHLSTLKNMNKLFFFALEIDSSEIQI